MGSFNENINSSVFYLIVAGVLIFITIMCLVFLVKSYQAGIKIGMDKAVLRKTIVSSATFTLLPSISILIGVVALMMKLGVPLSWLRLSVIGSLQYELQVANTAAESMKVDLVTLADMDSFVTIALVMTAAILGGVICCIFFLKKYLNKIQKAPKKEKTGKPGFGAHATVAMFVGLCGAYIGAFIGEAVTGKLAEDGTPVRSLMPILVAIMAAGAMAVFEYFIQKKGKTVLENFSLATSMLIAMVGAVLISLI